MNPLQEWHDEDDGEGVRKPYATPQIQIYGDVRQITQSDKPLGNQDSPSHNKTHV